ncbi:MAG TPA: biotin/lipoyl-binding protein [Anaerolineae bacterium]|nr:biotin/lipoyl-binding protein [Anaerolineae bacterium]
MGETKEFTLTLDDTDYKIVVDGNSFLVNGQPFVVGFEDDRVLVDGAPYDVRLEGDQVVVGGITYSLKVEGLGGEKAGLKKAAVEAGEGAVTAIMPGKIIRILATEGDQVAEGDVICILEAMKMENELKAPRAGIVKKLHVQEGQDVVRGAVLAEIE